MRAADPGLLARRNCIARTGGPEVGLGVATVGFARGLCARRQAARVETSDQLTYCVWAKQKTVVERVGIA